MATRRSPAIELHPEATVRIGPALGIPTVLRRLNLDPAAVLAEAGVDLALFDDGDNLIPFRVRSKLFQYCADRSGCPHFGLLVGELAGLEAMGLVGLLMKYSPVVEASLSSLIRYSHLHVRGASVALDVQRGVATLSYLVLPTSGVTVDQIGDGAVAVLFNMLRSLCGPDWKPLEVYLARPKPEVIAPYRQFFKAPLDFGAERNGLAFDADWLKHRLSADDPALRRLLQQQIEALDARFSNDFPSQVRSVLQTALLSGHAGADQVAALFSMHSRTLNRRLNDAGTNFRALLDEGRFSIARQMLLDTGRGVRDVAFALGYADSSAFTRAFRRWSGATPAVWREREQTAMQLKVPLRPDK